MLLAIDTATSLAGIALLDDERVRGWVQWPTERNHTVELLPNIVALLRESDASAQAVRAVAVAIGPGSYTGLRIGLSVAKGFCFAHGAALVGVPTLDISAHAYTPRDATLCAILQAGRGRLTAAFYVAVDGTWRVSGHFFMGRADELAVQCIYPQTFFVGEVDAQTELTLREQLGERATFAPATERQRDPRVLARLGWDRWQRGQHDKLEQLVPVYG